MGSDKDEITIAFVLFASETTDGRFSFFLFDVSNAGEWLVSSSVGLPDVVLSGVDGVHRLLVGRTRGERGREGRCRLEDDATGPLEQGQRRRLHGDCHDQSYGDSTVCVFVASKVGPEGSLSIVSRTVFLKQYKMGLPVLFPDILYAGGRIFIFYGYN